jgi:hypothetical protein
MTTTARVKPNVACRLEPLEASRSALGDPQEMLTSHPQINRARQSST